MMYDFRLEAVEQTVIRQFGFVGTSRDRLFVLLR